MAKALYGHVGTVDQRLRDEVQRLRVKTRDLEFENARLRADKDRLEAAQSGARIADSMPESTHVGVSDEELRRMASIEEPALT